MNGLLHYVAGLTLLLCGAWDTAWAEEPAWLDTLKGGGHGTKFTALTEVPLNFNTHHPQGMTIIGERIYLSSVEVFNRKEGNGKGYLFELNMQGELLRTLELGEGLAYHPSGLDFDGKYIWVAVAEYRPDSSSIIYRVDPATMTATEEFRFDDHIGGIVSVPPRRELIGVSWGSRRIYRWKVKESAKVVNPHTPEMVINGNHFIDYQDGQWVRGTNYVLFGGLKSFRGPGKDGARVAVGGMALVDTKTMQIESAVPVPLYSRKGRVMNQNPFYVQGTGDGMTMYFIPDDNESLMYRFTVE